MIQFLINKTKRHAKIKHECAALIKKLTKTNLLKKSFYTKIILCNHDWVKNNVMLAMSYF